LFLQTPKPEVAPQPNRIHGSTITIVCCSCIKHYQTPKPDIGWAPHLFHDFAIRRLTLCGVLHREFVNPETRKGPGPHSICFFFLRFENCCLWRWVFVNPEIPNPETPKYWAHIPFTFSRFGVVVCWCLAFVIAKPRTPKPKVLGPQPFRISGFDKQRGLLFFVFGVCNRRNPIDLHFFNYIHFKYTYIYLYTMQFSICIQYVGKLKSASQFTCGVFNYDALSYYSSNPNHNTNLL
jgi:hypothetical protein